MLDSFGSVPNWTGRSVRDDPAEGRVSGFICARCRLTVRHPLCLAFYHPDMSRTTIDLDEEKVAAAVVDSAVHRELTRLGLLTTCVTVDLKVMYSARTPAGYATTAARQRRSTIRRSFCITPATSITSPQ